jgi:hypothetical protein
MGKSYYVYALNHANAILEYKWWRFVYAPCIWKILMHHNSSRRIDGYDALYADFQFATYILKKARLLQDMSIFRTYHPKLMEHSPIF